MSPKKINCKWCGMGHAPKADGNHWIVKSIIPAKITIAECAYHKAAQASGDLLGFKTLDDLKPDLVAMIKADTIGGALVILARLPRSTVDYPKIIIERMK